MLREILRYTRIHTATAGRVASRYRKAVRYGLDLVLWSRLLSSRRAPIPLDLPLRLLQTKDVHLDPPCLFVATPGGEFRHWEEGFQAVHATLFLNLQKPDVLSAIRYAHPAPSFHGIYLWDSAFTAQVWKHWDQQVAWDVNRAVLDLAEVGRLQHVVATFTESKYTQPPVMAWSVARLLANDFRLPPDVLQQEYYEPLVAYHAWLQKHRLHSCGLYFWEHPYESGIDNSPRFSSRDESRFAETRKMVSPDFSAYMVLQCESLAELAEWLGHDEDTQGFRKEADELRAAMNALLWDATDGFYYDRWLETGDFVRSSTIAGLLPLWAGVPDEQQALRLKEHIENPATYNTLIPLPTVARNDPEFVKDMWRGPVWINTAYAVIEGLKRYGFDETAADFAFRLCDGVFRTYRQEQKLFEFYDPERCDLDELFRKQGNRFKHFTLGSKPVSEFVGWTGLVNTLVIEELFGYRRNGKAVTLQPRFPAALAGKGFHLRLPQYRLAIEVERLSEGQHECTCRMDGKVFSRTLAAGETWELPSDAEV